SARRSCHAPCAARWMAARMRWYVPQRQMLVIAVSMSASVGCGVFASSAAAAMICPDWQKPHCGTSSSIHARCTACARFLRSEEHTSELQSLAYLVCRLLLEKKKL